MATPDDAAARAFYVPIVYGSVSQWLGKKSGSGESTHKWSVFLRHPEGSDLSYAIQKVVFQLHNTFAEPTRGLLLQITGQMYSLAFLWR
jgi:transcription initiation factor IIF auxiliary subunit